MCTDTPAPATIDIKLLQGNKSNNFQTYQITINTGNSIQHKYWAYDTSRHADINRRTADGIDSINIYVHDTILHADPNNRTSSRTKQEIRGHVQEKFCELHQKTSKTIQQQ